MNTEKLHSKQNHSLNYTEKYTVAPRMKSVQRMNALGALVNAGIVILEEHDILQLILSPLLSRQAANSMAETLLARFGSLASILHASAHELSSIKEIGQIGASYIRSTGLTALHLLGESSVKQEGTIELKYVRSYLAALIKERDAASFFLMYFNRDNLLITTEYVWCGVENQIMVHLRTLIQRCLNLDAQTMVMVHHDPNGNPELTQDDLQEIKQLARGCEDCGVYFGDFFLFGRETIWNFRNEQTI